MHDERLVAGKSVIALGAMWRFVVGRFRWGEVGGVETCPFLLLFVPPDQFFALAPRLAIGTRRCAVVENAAVIRPGEAPAVTVEPARLALAGLVFTLRRHDAGIDPAAARGR